MIVPDTGAVRQRKLSPPVFVTVPVVVPGVAVAVGVTGVAVAVGVTGVDVGVTGVDVGVGVPSSEMNSAEAQPS
jgi:hypothetical protein